MMRWIALVLALLAAVVSGGCRRVAAYDPAMTDAAPPVLDLAAELSTVPDAAGPDFSVDQGRPADLPGDLGPPDAPSPEGPLASDAAAIPDAPVPDLPALCGAMDVNGDGAWDLLDVQQLQACFGQPAALGCAKADLNGDGSIGISDFNDLRSGLALCDPTFTFPCAAGTTLQQVYAPNAATCGGALLVDQCNAEANSCGPGWSMCTATQFKARHGNLPAKALAWIKGCVRDGGAAFAPTDSLCALGCDSTSMAPAQVAWRCSDGARTDIFTKTIGLSSNTDCFRVGVNETSTEAMWKAQMTTLTLFAAVCCR